MIILLLNLIIILIEAIIIFGIVRPKRLARNFYCLLIFVQLYILHAFVDPHSMVDLPNYEETFNSFSSNTLYYSLAVGYVGVKMEVGWIILCKILSILYDKFIILLLFTSTIIVGSFCVTIWKYSPIVWLSVFIFLCTLYDQSLYVLRQYTAMSICLFSIPFIAKNRGYVFLCLYLIAVSLHTTAIIFGLVYIINKFEYNKSFWKYYVLLLLVGSFLSSFLFEWLFSNTWYNSYSEKEGSNFTGFLMSLCTVILYLYTCNWKLSNITSIEKCLFTMALLAVGISFMGVGFSPTNRLVKYFTISSIFLIPISLDKLKDYKLKYLVALVIMVFYTLLFFSSSNLTYIENYKLLI